jgi:hypothetical protein
VPFAACTWRPLKSASLQMDACGVAAPSAVLCTNRWDFLGCDTSTFERSGYAQSLHSQGSHDAASSK